MTFWVLLFLVMFSCTSALTERQFQVSISCSKCEVGGLTPFTLTGNISGNNIKPTGYELFHGVGYYKFYTEGAMTYYQALSTCKNDGAHLAIINSQTEEEVLKSIYAKNPSAKPWAYLGFNDIEKEGDYVTIFGERLCDTGFMKWHPGKPDNHEGNEDCGSMFRHGGLNDLYCDKHGPWPFFCEYELPGHPSPKIS
ncbi:hemolymph lipopolysaccharide-binding protein-like [Hetaerina americana]|uniref:hemolymph lipopolysaccharide-binding protein-like n=1 Tax=Hetaerina americana TaxID=62018 RepID=UPI003A7F2587